MGARNKESVSYIVSELCKVWIKITDAWSAASFNSSKDGDRGLKLENQSMSIPFRVQEPRD
jgi:hypothetical protein